jgi:type 1 fimbriae regulatory protein FimB/type 1 fimbriae regulatory protein FimE
MTKAKLKLVTPAAEKRTVEAPGRVANSDYRSREYLTPKEVERLRTAATKNRWGHRDATMILVAYHHGLRASELCDMQWTDVDFDRATLHIRRRKDGVTGSHPINGEELRALRRLKREQEPRSQWIFATERGGPFTTAGFNRMVERAGEAANLSELKPHAHMLRHSAGYKLANDGRDTRLIQDYMGHKSIASTARYTALASGRFKGLF